MTYASDRQMKILFLTAEPTDTSRLRLQQELREIQQRLQLANQRERFQLEYGLSARPGDVSQKILDFQPDIVHFSGHGASTGELCFENTFGQVQPVKPQALAALFELVANQVQCVLLNACHSVIQAEAIVQHIPFVIGMNTAIGDRAAIAFSVGFYKARGANRPYEEAFRFGCVEIQLEGISEELTPVIRRKIAKQSSSNFYIERPAIEEQCYQEIREPGALIRIKAPDKMGKTYLVNRILTYATANNYQTVTLNCSRLINTLTKTDMERFLRLFCAAVSQELGLTNQVNERWDNLWTPMENTIGYFQEYLLPKTANYLVLALNNVDLIFEQNELSQEFCRLLRSFYDMARYGDVKSQIWKRLRLIIAHSTEVYASLDINSSPLANLRLVIDLPDFEQEQVQRLVELYGLNWNIEQVERLMDMVGGHPNLLTTGIDHIKSHQNSLEQFLEEAPTLAGAYKNHLQELLEKVENNPELKTAFIQVISANENNPVQLRPRIAISLYYLGLVKFQGNCVQPRCKLYRSYFRVFLE
ncbi:MULTISPECIES: AAA-like domain-containing protein [unclassified Nostoc]|uniref:AAA-like domain-containing protein n=1 Tax=unclassified Nostoc TaxID=2593658 RepID=UPI002612415F|nr:AAA-like domain-containing protein [Nostoc sp. S13]MDF5735367.1 AAA-like domain-containing protein [Nostoc sp. S13]